MEVSLQVEEDRRTVASGAAQVTGIKETQQTKTCDGSINLLKFSVKLTRSRLLVLSSLEKWSRQRQVSEII